MDCTENGLNHFKKTKKLQYSNVPDKNTPYGWSLCEESDSTIWVGRSSNGGLDLFNKKTGKFKNYKNNPADINTISNDQLSDIYRDGVNDLWIGTFNSGGLNKLDIRTGKVTRYLFGLEIGKIYRDAAGILWVATDAGLFRYDKQTDGFKALANENSENNITGVEGIVADKEDNLWLSTLKGIYMVTKNRDKVIHYGKESVAPGNNFTFYPPSCFVRQDGEISFGNRDGYYAFYPEKLKERFTYDQLYFTRFWLGNKEIKPGVEGPLKESLYTTRNP
jgi:ligand-binding sensor domain-containing protein